MQSTPKYGSPTSLLASKTTRSLDWINCSPGVSLHQQRNSELAPSNRAPRPDGHPWRQELLEVGESREKHTDGLSGPLSDPNSPSDGPARHGKSSHHNQTFEAVSVSSISLIWNLGYRGLDIFALISPFPPLDDYACRAWYQVLAWSEFAGRHCPSTNG